MLKYGKFRCLIALLTVVIIIGGCVNNTNVQKTNDNHTAESSNTSESFYRIACLYGSDGNLSFSDLFGYTDSLERLKNMNKALKDSFDYWEINFQPVYFVGYYKLSEQFVNSYNEATKTADTVNQNATTEDGRSIKVTDLKTVQVCGQLSKKYDNLISAGKNFDDSDYKIENENDYVNVLLGSNYANYYKLDDVIDVTLHQKEIKFRVIGFFDAGASVMINNKEIKFDDCIVMPFYDIDYEAKTQSDESYQKIYYSQKNEGYINASENSFDQLNQKLNDITQKNDLLYSLATAEIKIETGVSK